MFSFCPGSVVNVGLGYAWPATLVSNFRIADISTACSLSLGVHSTSVDMSACKVVTLVLSLPVGLALFLTAPTQTHSVQLRAAVVYADVEVISTVCKVFIKVSVIPERKRMSQSSCEKSSVLIVIWFSIYAVAILDNFCLTKKNITLNSFFCVRQKNSRMATA